MSVLCFFLDVLIYLIRLNMLLEKMRRKTRNFCVIRSFLWHMEPFFYFHIQLSALFAVVDMVSWGLMDLENQRLCANYVMVK